MAKLITEVNLLDIEPCTTLFELIGDNVGCIGEPLLSRLKEWADSEDKGWVSWTDIAPEFIDNESCSVIADGEDQLLVCGYNKILRKIKVYNKDINKFEVFSVKSFSINNIGFANFVEWS